MNDFLNNAINLKKILDKSSTNTILRVVVKPTTRYTGHVISKDSLGFLLKTLYNEEIFISYDSVAELREAKENETQ